LRSEDAALESNKSFDPTESHRIDGTLYEHNQDASHDED